MIIILKILIGYYLQILIQIKNIDMGFASLLINTLYDDIKNYKGLYLLVDIKNLNAVKLYKKLGFNLVKKYKINKVIYYIMCKGSYDTDQFENIKFNN